MLDERLQCRCLDPYYAYAPYCSTVCLCLNNSLTVVVRVTGTDVQSPARGRALRTDSLIITNRPLSHACDLSTSPPGESMYRTLAKIPRRLSDVDGAPFKRTVQRTGLVAIPLRVVWL